MASSTSRTAALSSWSAVSRAGRVPAARRNSYATAATSTRSGPSSSRKYDRSLIGSDPSASRMPTPRCVRRGISEASKPRPTAPWPSTALDAVESGHLIAHRRLHTPFRGPGMASVVILCDASTSSTPAAGPRLAMSTIASTISSPQAEVT